MNSLKRKQDFLAKLCTNKELLKEYVDMPDIVLIREGFLGSEISAWETIPIKQLTMYVESLSYKKQKYLYLYFKQSYALLGFDFSKLFEKFIEKKSEYMVGDKGDKVITFSKFVMKEADGIVNFKHLWLRELLYYEAMHTIFLKSSQKFKIIFLQYEVDKIDIGCVEGISNLASTQKIRKAPHFIVWYKSSIRRSLIKFSVPCFINLSSDKSRIALDSSIILIADSLKNDGYIYLDKKFSEKEFYSLAEKLGTIINKQDVCINEYAGYRFLLPQKLDFHTDRYETDIIGWLCIKQDDTAGYSCIIDMHHILKYFSLDEIAQLSSIHMCYPNSSKYQEVPLLNKIKARYYICYHPWADVKFSNSTIQKPLFNFFLSYLKQAEQSNQVKIRLNSGEILFIDNKRMLHGRDELPHDSNRFLKRVWIAKNK